MKPLFLGIASGILLFAFTFATTRAFSRSSAVTLEKPPCRACARIYSQSSSIPTVDFCEFAANEQRYANQLVRVNSMFTHDAGQTILTAPEGKCQEKRLGILTGLDQACEACAGARKALSIYSGFEEWYDSRAIVTVVGRMGSINNPKSYYSGQNGFNILCLEQVEPLGSGEPERRKYESWLYQLIKAI